MRGRENRYPLRVERYELMNDSGGAGEFRGGLGVRIDYRVLDHDARCRHRSTATGSLRRGSSAAAKGALRVVRRRRRRRGAPGAQGRRDGRAPGTLISHRTGGGGGYGDPAKRDPEAVRADVTEGT